MFGIKSFKNIVTKSRGGVLSTNHYCVHMDHKSEWSFNMINSPHGKGTGFIPPQSVKCPDTPLLNRFQNILKSCDCHTFRAAIDEALAQNVASDDEFRTVYINFSSISEAWAVYTLSAFVVTKYIWVDSANPTKRLPKYLGWLFFASSKFLKIVPAVTHAAVNLGNWKKKDESKGYEIENLDVMYTTLSHDPQAEISEKWFYKIHMAFELQCGSSLQNVFNIMKILKDTNDVANTKNDGLLIKNFKELAMSMDRGAALINRMYEQCNKDDFYLILRNFLSGTEKVPGGLEIYNGSEYITVSDAGGSAAQSTLIQLWDIIVDIEHLGHAKPFLMNMRNYMPKQHRALLEDFELEKSSLPLSPEKYVLATNRESLKIAYNECVISMRNLRLAHYNLVHHYIVSFNSGLQELHTNVVINKTTGSGGTDPVRFNRSCIDATTSKILVSLARAVKAKWTQRVVPSHDMIATELSSKSLEKSVGNVYLGVIISIVVMTILNWLWQWSWQV